MKRFIKGITFFLLPIVIAGIFFEVLLRKIPNDYKYKSGYLDKNSSHIKTLYLGSSHVYYGIDPSYLETNTFNASYVAQYLNYDLAILKKYNNKWNTLKRIIVPVDYFSLYGKLEAGGEAWRKKNYVIYYHIKFDAEIADHMEILSQFKVNLLKLYNYYYLKDKGITSSALGWGTGYSSKIKNDLIETGKSAALRHSSKDDRYFNENLEILKSILAFAKAKNIEVFLFTAPAYKTYIKNLDSTQLNRTINAAIQIAGSNQNVTYFNLLKDPSFDKADFFDADHLNEIGTKKLTLKLDSLIKETEQKKNTERK
jgi:hypothetical protein